MRKILFRGKEIDTGKWAYGNYYYEAKKQNKPYYITWNGEDALGDFGDRYHPVHNVIVDPATIGQYTGLKDKNGTKIFAGDIVKVLGMVGKIVYECGSFGINTEEGINYKRIENFTKDNLDNTFEGTFCDNFIPLFELYCNFNNVDDYIDEIEVIGNIFDNAKILEKVEG